MKNKYYLIMLIVSITLISLQTSSIKVTYPDINQDELLEFELKYREETNEDEKKYLEPVIRPIKFDLNKDGKISKREIREALKYVLYPKDPLKKIDIGKELDTYVKNNIDLFIKNLDEDSFTFKQFSNLMKKISPFQFLNPDVVQGFQKMNKLKTNEFEGDL